MTAAGHPVSVRSERLGIAPPLSPRQLEALRTYAETASRAVVADRMGISSETVRNHLHNAYEALGVTSNIQAFRKLGWLRVPHG